MTLLLWLQLQLTMLLLEGRKLELKSVAVEKSQDTGCMGVHLWRRFIQNEAVTVFKKVVNEAGFDTSTLSPTLPSHRGTRRI